MHDPDGIRPKPLKSEIGPIRTIRTLYEQGQSLRQLSERFECSYETIRRRLKEQPSYRQLVTHSLQMRCDNARTRKDFEHHSFIFKRQRPKAYLRWLMRQGPKLPGSELFGGIWRANCDKCMGDKTIFADKRGKAWHWRCASCEVSGVVRTRQKRSTSLPSINKP